MIHETTMLFDEGKITTEEFANLIDGIESDYNHIVSEMDKKEMSEICCIQNMARVLFSLDIFLLA